MTPRFFRKRPVVIEAVQWTGRNVAEISIFTEGESRLAHPDLIVPILVIHTLEGDHLASPGDWIISGIRNEFYPCKPDIFEQTYEEVSGH